MLILCLFDTLMIPPNAFMLLLRRQQMHVYQCKNVALMIFAAAVALMQRCQYLRC